MSEKNKDKEKDEEQPAENQGQVDKSDKDKDSNGKDGGDGEKTTVEHGFKLVAITLTVIGASLLELIDTTIVNVSLPVIRGNLGATLNNITWVIAAYAMANAIVVPMTGYLGTVFGRRNYFVGSIILFTICSYLCGQSTTLVELVIFRFVQGIGGGALLATSQAVLVEIFPDDKLGFANAMFGIGAVVGPTLGPIIGGYITDEYSWPWIFYVNLPVGIIAATASFYLIKEPPEEQKTGKFDWQGLLLLIVGIGSLQVILEKGADENWFTTDYITVFTCTAVISTISFIYWELKQAKNPIVDLSVLANRSTAIGTLFVFILGIGLYGYVFLYPQFVQNILGFTAYQAGISMLPGGISALLTMPLLAIMLSKGVSPRLLAGIGFVLFFVSCYLISVETVVSGGDIFWGDFFWSQVWRGVSTAMLFVPLTTIALSGLKGSDVGSASGLTNMGRQLGGSFGLALIATFTLYRDAFFRGRLVEDITRFGADTQHRVDILVQGFMAKGSTIAEATTQAYGVINNVIIKNTLALSYTEAYFWVGIFFLACIPLLLLVPKVESDGAPPPA